MARFGPPPGSNIKKPKATAIRERNVAGRGGKGGRIGSRNQPHQPPREKLPMGRQTPIGNEISPMEKKTNTLKRDASRAVTYRESLLLQLNSVVLHWPGENISRRESRQTTDAVRILANLSKQLGEAGLKCVEKIVAWVLVVSDASGPKSFLWNGSDYLVKMFTDMDFVTKQLGPKAWSMGNFCDGNPLLLSSEEMAGRGPHGKAHAARVRAASMVLLDVLNRNGGIEKAPNSPSISIPEGDRPTSKPAVRISTGNSSPRMSRGPSREAFAIDESKGRGTNQKPKERTNSQKRESNLKTGGKAKPTPPQIKSRENQPLKKDPEPKMKKKIESDVSDEGKRVKTAEVRESKEVFDVSDEGKRVKTAEVRESKEVFDVSDEGKRVKTAEVRESKEVFDMTNESKRVSEADDEVLQRSTTILASSEPKECEEDDDEYDEEDYEDEEYEEEEDVDTTTTVTEPEAAVVQPTAWKDLRVLGEGNYGTVSEVIRGSERGAMKRFKIDDEDDEETKEYALRTQKREIDLAKLLVHQNVVQVLDFSETSVPYLVFELMPMNLLDLLQKHPSGLDATTTKSMTQQLCEGVGYCHQMSVVHRDLKPENILVDPNSCILKLCDFGASRRLDISAAANRNQMDELDDMTNYVGSRWYRGPESLANRTAYRFEIDIWGVACISAEMATGQNLFGGDDEAEVLVSIMSLIGVPPKYEAEQFELHDMPVPSMPTRRSFTSPVSHMRGLGFQGISLLTSMLQWDPKARPSMAACLAHQYFLGPPSLEVTGGTPAPTSPGASSISSGEHAAAHEDDVSIESQFEEPEEEVDEEEEIVEDATKQEKEAVPEFDALIDRVWSDNPHIANSLKKLANGDTSATSQLSTLLEADRQGLFISQMEKLLKEMGALPNSTSSTPLANICRGFNVVITGHIHLHVEWCEAWISSKRGTDTAVLNSLSDAFKGSDLAQKSPRATKRTEDCLATCASCLGASSHLLTGSQWKACENECLNKLIGILTPMLLDPQSSGTEKETSLKLLQNTLFGLLLTDQRSLLSPSSISVVLHTRLEASSSTPPHRLSVTTDRHSALDTTISSIRNAFPTGRYQASQNQPALIELCPYYKSQYGKKRSEGFAVEEGEGLGPRKELFALITEQLRSPWSCCGDAVISFQSGMAVVHVLSARVDGRVLSGADIKPSLLGHKLELASGDPRVILSSIQSSDDACVFRVDRAMEEASTGLTVRLFKKTAPLFSYLQGSERVWLNQNMPRGPLSEDTAFFAGLLLGLTFINSCHIHLPFPLVLFEAILDSNWKPKLCDLLSLDPTCEDSLASVKKMKEKQFSEFIEVEFGSSPPIRMAQGSLSERHQAYIESFVDEFFEPAIAWQLGCLRRGFFTAMPSPSLTAHDLLRVISGEADSAETDFAFRSVFRLKLDPDFASCEPLQTTFWSVVDSMSVTAKRKLLLFITGVDRLPSLKSELLTIDIPFYPMGLDDHRKVLGMIPQSHTCDNVFELPNYWKSLEHLDKGKSSKQELLTRLRTLLVEKLSVACDNAAGYGLDGLEGSDASDESSINVPLNETEDAVEESMGESSGHISIPAMLDDDEEETIESPAAQEPEPKVRAKTPEEPVDDDYEDDYEEEFEFDEESTEL